jgi:hypothetical protein
MIRGRNATPRDRMLEDFLRARTTEEKRKVIENFSPHYFALFNSKPTKENQNEQVEV